MTPLRKYINTATAREVERAESCDSRPDTDYFLAAVLAVVLLLMVVLVRGE